MEFEQLVNAALAFLEEDLMAERALVVHPDPGERVAAVQGHRGFSAAQLAEVDTLRWQWQEAGLVEWEQGRSSLGHPLTNGGLLYADHSNARFQEAHLQALREFAADYQAALDELAARPAPLKLLEAFPAAERARDFELRPDLLVVDWL